MGFFQVAQSTLAEMVENDANLFIPFIEEIVDIFEQNDQILDEHTPTLKKMMNIAMKVLPALVIGEKKLKLAAYRIIILDMWNRRICSSNVPVIWLCLKIGINETDEVVRKAAFGAVITFCWEFTSEIFEIDYENYVFVVLLQTVESFCRDELFLDTDEDGYENILINSFDVFCQKLGKNFAAYLPTVMERMFNALDSSETESQINVVLESIKSVFKFAGESKLPYLPRLKEQLKIFWVRKIMECWERAADVAYHIDHKEFAQFSIGVALEIFDETSDHKVRTGLCVFFGNLYDSIAAEFWPEIVSRMLRSLQIDEADVYENIAMIHAEKEQAIISLERLATEAAFVPHINVCADAVNAQLNHPEKSIRRAAVEALTVFMLSFAQNDNVKRSQQLTAKVTLDFAFTLETDSESANAIAVFDGYQKLLSESPIVFDGNMHLFNVVFDCISDVMRAKIACQVGNDFYANTQLISGALGVFEGLGSALQPFEFAVYFTSFLPILSDKLKSANKDANGFRLSVYETLSNSILVLKAYTSSSFDVLFPLLLTGLDDEYEHARAKAVAGLGNLLLFAKEEAEGKSSEVTTKLLNLLANEKDASVVGTACGAIARLIMDNSAVISMEQLLPKMIEQLEEGRIRYPREVYQCYHVLLLENNQILEKSLLPIVLNGFDFLIKNMWLSTNAREAIMEFLKECRKKFGFIIDQALIMNPQATGIVQKL